MPVGRGNQAAGGVGQGGVGVGHHAGGDGVLAVFTVKRLHRPYLAVACEAVTFIYHSKGPGVPGPTSEQR
ncbi:hypothetical protein C9975_10700 [Thalassospira xiamenensis]|nr:hypothetical protein C9975_10700 [Thalassospira xiamenensis]